MLHTIRILSRSFSTNSRHLAKEADKLGGVRSYNEVPTRRDGKPIDPKYLHKHCDRVHKELGPIYKENLGTIELVFISDTKLIQAVLANEGQYPHHNVPESWLIYNKIKKIERGLFFQTGESWAKLRHVFNRILLSDANIIKFSHDIVKINSNLFSSWTVSGDGWIKIKDIKSELCKWSIEATGLMLFGNRLGCIPDSSDSITDQRASILVQNVAKMFQETSNLQLIPKEAYNSQSEVWNRFEEATTNMIRIANEFTQENISKAKLFNSNESLVKELLTVENLTEDDLSRSMVDLVIAAADTTSNSLQWMLYMLAKRPDIQNKILDEVTPFLEDLDQIDSLKENTPYLKAFIREVSRLYPTAPFLARTLDKSIILNNYLIPPHKPFVFSLYTTSRMEKYFDQPLEFKPERWLRNSLISRCPAMKSRAYASLPFGIGARNCIGRRMAELEMSLLIASFVKEFECRLMDEDDVEIKLNMILCPSKPIQLNLRPRSSVL